MIKIGIIGTGGIGKRHMQAISKISDPVELACYDISKTSLDSVDTFVKENKIHFDNLIKFDTFEAFLKNIDEKTFVIISTTANNRVELVEKIVLRTPKCLIVEKPVCQNDKEYKKIQTLTRNIPTYVNFPRHAYDVYRDFKKKIQKNNKYSVIIHRGNEGFACNGIHFIELICWLFDVEKYILKSSEIYSTFETKRPGFYDFSGNVKLILDGNIFFKLNFSNDKTLGKITFVENINSFEVLESMNKTIRIDSKDVIVENIEIPYQSNLTNRIICELTNTGKTILLPSLDDCYIPHKILFEIMDINNLSGLNIT